MSDSDLRIGSGVPGPATPYALRPKKKRPIPLGVWLVAAVLVLVVGGISAVLVLQSRPAGGPFAAASPTGKVATVGQYAGIVNHSMKGIRESWEKYDDHFCTYKADSKDLVCALGLSTVDLGLQALVLELGNAANPNTKVYIGEPPAEIAQLVSDTIALAETIANSIPELGTKIGEDIRRTAFFQMNRLLAVFDRWEPYI